MTAITRAEALKGLLAFSALTTVLAGCAGEGAGNPGAGSAKGKDTVTVDYATYNPLSLVIKKKGWLEKALQEKGKNWNGSNQPGQTKPMRLCVRETLMWAQLPVLPRCWPARTAHPLR